MSSNFNDLLIEIGVDTSSAKKSMKELDKMFDGLGKSFTQAVGKKPAKDPFNLEAERARMQKYIKEMEKLGAETESYQKRLKGLKNKSQFVEMKKDLAKYKKDFMSFKDAAAKENLRDIKLIERQTKLLEKRNRVAEAYSNNIRRSAGYQAANDSQKSGIEGRISKARTEFNMTGNREVFKDLSNDVKSFKRQLIGLQTVQGGLTDSTRNMIRSYASLFALWEGTTAIKRVGQDFEAMNSSMLAASGGPENAGKDLIFINGLVDQMGLNLKNTADAWVKFKFAAKGKISQTQIEDIFTSVSMFGTSLKVGPEDMKRAQKALSQMLSKGTVMSEELKGQ